MVSRVEGSSRLDGLGRRVRGADAEPADGAGPPRLGRGVAAARGHDGPRTGGREAQLRLPFDVADYVDFYSSLEHASNIGRILRPAEEPLTRTGAGFPSATTAAQARSSSAAPTSSAPTGSAGCGRREFGPTERLDVELELGFVVGVPRPASRSRSSEFAEHVFGVVLVNDWSARDIQAWEYVPLGPFLGKSFQTSISAWVTPLALLEPRRVEAPPQEPAPLEHLAGGRDWALDLELEIELNGEVVSRGNARALYWTMPQQLAHATSNGASVRTGDLFATGAISGPSPGRRDRCSSSGRASASWPTATRSSSAPAAATSSSARFAAGSSPERIRTHELRPPRPAVRRGSRRA